MPKGNPNPSPATRFKPGQSGNPGGITSRTAELRTANAEMAYALQNKGLSALVAIVEQADPATIAKLLTDTGAIALMKEGIDRKDGKPAQTVRGDAENPLPFIVRTVYEGD